MRMEPLMNGISNLIKEALVNSLFPAMHGIIFCNFLNMFLNPKKQKKKKKTKNNQLLKSRVKQKQSGLWFVICLYLEGKVLLILSHAVPSLIAGSYQLFLTINLPVKVLPRYICKPGSSHSPETNQAGAQSQTSGL